MSGYAAHATIRTQTNQGSGTVCSFRRELGSRNDGLEVLGAVCRFRWELAFFDEPLA